MDWYEATQRQVGAPGIGEVRRLLANARDGAAQDRRDRALLIAAATALVLVAMLLVGLPAASVAEPLPPGSYAATTPAGDVRVVVGADGTVDVEAPPSLTVELAFDEAGRPLDTFTVTGPGTTWNITVEVDRAAVREEPEGEDEGRGEDEGGVAPVAPPDDRRQARDDGPVGAAPEAPDVPEDAPPVGGTLPADAPDDVDAGQDLPVPPVPVPPVRPPVTDERDEADDATERSDPAVEPPGDDVRPVVPPGHDAQPPRPAPEPPVEQADDRARGTAEQG